MLLANITKFSLVMQILNEIFSLQKTKNPPERFDGFFCVLYKYIMIMNFRLCLSHTSVCLYKKSYNNCKLLIVN